MSRGLKSSSCAKKRNCARRQHTADRDGDVLARPAKQQQQQTASVSSLQRMPVPEKRYPSGVQKCSDFKIWLTNLHPQMLRLHEPYEPCPTELKAFMQFLQTQGRQGSIPRAARQLHLEARRPGGGPLLCRYNNLVSFVDRFETNLCPDELYVVFLYVHFGILP